MTCYLDLSGFRPWPLVRRAACAAMMVLGCLASGLTSQAQVLPWSQRLANSVVERWPDGHLGATNERPTPSYAMSVLLSGMNAAWYESANGDYYHYAARVADQYLASSEESTALAKELLLLSRVTRDPKYFKAANSLREELAKPLPGQQEGNREGAQLYVEEPFFAEYSSVFQEPDHFAEITKKFVSTKQQMQALKAANAGDGLGWYMMALVDSLDFYPSNDPDLKTLAAILDRSARAAILRRDEARNKTSSTARAADCMSIYALQKGVRMGYLAQHYAQDAKRAWQGTTRTMSLKGAPEEPAEAGECLLAATEIEMGSQSIQAHGQTVVVDAWFNSQRRQNAAGQEESFHYKWDDYSDSGFSFLGHIFASHGAALATLDQAPTRELLRKANYYIIASPDIPVKNPHPHYVEAKDAAEIAQWVKGGGVLVLMPNDPANGDIDHLDLLADKFGIHFEKTLAHHVVGEQFSPGMIPVELPSILFHAAHALYMKDTCTISLTAPAQPLLGDKSGAVIAVGEYGKGTVVAVVDPWLYNEYTDHRKVLPEQDNFAAGKEFVTWLLQQSHSTATQPSLKH